jgi:K+-transporting ATPase ATPase C chain
MKGLFVEIRRALIATIILALLTCGAYPLIVWGAAQLFFSEKANGSLITNDGAPIASTLIGPAFTGAEYFHPRPSAVDYNAAGSGGSNLGPISRKLIDQVRSRAAAYRLENGLSTDAVVPADAVTSSGSGLDPHISVENALLQAKRVAEARGVSDRFVRDMITAHTEGRDLWILGEPRVNVVKLNLALDEIR